MQFLDTIQSGAAKGAFVYSIIGVICLVVLIAGFVLLRRVIFTKKGKGTDNWVQGDISGETCALSFWNWNNHNNFQRSTRQRETRMKLMNLSKMMNLKLGRRRNTSCELIWDWFITSQSAACNFNQLFATSFKNFISTAFGLTSRSVNL